MRYRAYRYVLGRYSIKVQQQLISKAFSRFHFPCLLLLGHLLDKRGGWDQSAETAHCRELANVALQTKGILIALLKSAENSFEEAIIDNIDYQ
jgi:hypothetical protein